MERNDPFDILLDLYPEECNDLYHKLLKELGMQAEADSTYEQVQIDLKKAAFAYLCMEFLHEVIDVYPHGDFELFLEETGFDRLAPYLFYIMGQEGVNWNIDYELSEEVDEEENDWWKEAFNEMMFELIQKYMTWWYSEITKHYNTDEEIIKLLGQNIFKEYVLDSESMFKFYGFVSENFKNYSK